MPEKVKPVHGLHTYRSTGNPANFTYDVWLRKERRKAEHKTEEHHNAPVIDECLHFLKG